MSNHLSILFYDILVYIFTVAVLGIILQNYSLNFATFIIFLVILVFISTYERIGLARSLAPIIILCPFVIDKAANKYFLYTCLFIFTALIYPSALLIVLLLFGLLELVYIGRRGWTILTLKNLITAGAGILISILIVFAKSHQIELSHYGGELISSKIIMQNNLFGDGGRVGLRKFILEPFATFHDALLATTRIIIPHSRSIWSYIIIGFCGILTMLNLKRKEGLTLTSYALLLLISGSALYFIGVILMFQLYVPSRFLSYSFPIAFILILADFLLHNKFVKRYYVFTSILLSLILIQQSVMRRNFEDNYVAKQGFYQFIENTTVPGSLILGDLKTSNMIPFFSNRSVFVSWETISGILFSNSLRLQSQKLETLINIFTTTDLKELIALLKKNGITHLLLNKSITGHLDLNQLPQPYKTKYLDKVSRENNFVPAVERLLKMSSNVLEYKNYILVKL